MVRIRRFKPDAFSLLRKRMIRETELALAIGFRFPNRAPRIPVVEVGHGTFQPHFAEQFWQEALELDEGTIEAMQQVSGAASEFV